MKEQILTFSSDQNRMVAKEKIAADDSRDILSLRPLDFDGYVGQAETVQTLKIAIAAARKRDEPLEHILFHGPPGLGKTTLAHIVAAEMDANLVVTSGPALDKGGDLVGMLTHLKRGDILFIDEIHRLPRVIEEFLYPAMEDFAVDFVFDKGIHARSHRYRLNQFILIGATTRVGLLSAPLRDRFGLFRKFEFYTNAELVEIVNRSAALLGLVIDQESALELANRSRRTPRIVNRLLKRVRDYAQVYSDGTITLASIDAALSLEGVDRKGLTGLDRSYLETVINFYNGGPVGIEAIGATLQEEVDTLVDVVEPFLLAEGFLQRTSSGRRATQKAYQHLNVGGNCECG
ncbi:MAG: Holliday junction branch migration DNA helicase RuvB [Thermodesulfobacteriota bacterium]|nr:Holliday junction branch migration DNA helicase RuvB [Thermodesulfobacteriota bacterium]